jgi:DNA transformation protein
MSVSESFRDYVLDQLADLGRFETKSMFGGVALLHGGAAFAKIKHGTVWLRADDTNRSSFVERGMSQYTYGKGQSRKLNFYEAPAEVIEDPDLFVEWARRSMQVARRK